jgi:hypothetical protein
MTEHRDEIIILKDFSLDLPGRNAVRRGIPSQQRI